MTSSDIMRLYHKGWERVDIAEELEMEEGIEPVEAMKIVEDVILQAKKMKGAVKA